MTNVVRGRSPPPPPPSPLTPPLLPPLAPISPGAVPVPGMFVDRTSFDETDSFGVDVFALESTAYSLDYQQRLDSQAIIMRNGKVRRRLRWRPKGMMKRRRMPPSPRHDGLPMTRSQSSSNASVNSGSNASETSRQSKRSLHSFASIETQVKSNTSKSILQKRRFPLPRPNYSTTLDGIPALPTDSSSTCSSAATTISNEGQLLMTSRSYQKSAVFEPATTMVPIIEEKKEADGTEDTPSRPPLFRKPSSGTVTGSASGPTNSFDSGPGSGPAQQRNRVTSNQTAEDLPREQKVQSPFRISRSSISVGSDQGVHLSSPPDSPLSPSPTPMPILSGEEVERERRVDLRIRLPEGKPIRFGRGRRSHRRRTNLSESSMEFLSVEELRSNIEEMDNIVSQVWHTLSSSEKRDPSPSPSAKLKNSSGQVLSTLKSNSNIAGSRTARKVDPVIGPSFGTHPIEMCDLDDLDDDNDERKPSSRASGTPPTELRFAVDHSVNDFETSSVGSGTHDMVPLVAWLPPSPTRPPPTVPVDLDDCSFLEAEKNLQAIHDMATEHLQQGEYDEALEVFEEILRGQLARYGKDHFRVGTALHNIGVVHMRRGDYEKATKAYREAVAVRKIALSPDHSDVAASLAQLGVAYLERRMHRKAIAAFRESLKIRRSCLGNTHPKVAKILNNIGCALYELNALEVAQVAFEEALEIQRFNLRDSPVDQHSKSNYILLSIASTLSNIASIKLYFNNFDEASIDFQEALLIQQCVFGDDHPVPKQTEESLKWIDEARGPQASELGHFGIFSRLFRVGRGNNILACEDNTELAEAPSILSCATETTADARNVFGTVEQRLKALHDNIDLACGSEQESEEDDENDDFDYDDLSGRSFYKSV